MSLSLQAQVCFPLYAAARAMQQAYRPLLAQLGLTYPQFLVMLVLWEKDGTTVSALGEKLYLDSGTLTPLLKRMEARGLLRRVHCRQDKRVVHNYLSEAGVALRAQAQDIPTQLACKAGVDAEQAASARAMLYELRAAFAQAGA